MAEFALGLTKTAVAGTVSRVKLAIEEETKLRVRVQDDLVFITGELEMIQSFLNVANAERTNNQVVRTWVRQLRDLAFDVEDSVEFIVHLDKASPLDWVRRLAYSLMCMGMAGPPLPLDVAVADVKRLKARVQDVSQRNTRYNLIGDSGSSLRQHHHHDSSSSSNSSAPSHDLMLAATAGKSSSALHILREVWEATGKLRSGKGLRHLITGESENLEVISVWASSPGASAHLGVTHVMKEVYNHREICQEFKIRAWVKPTHPFNTQELLSSLLAQFYATSGQTNALDFRKMKDDDEIIQKLSQQRYLVVVEELSTLVEWDAIRMYLSSGKTHSRIVVVTQQLGLALSCTGEPYQVSELRQFSDGESLFAFFNKVPWRRSDLGDFIWQLRRRGTISVWGIDDGESSLVDEVYTCLIHKSDEFDGVKFQRHNWVNVSDPFDLNVFCWRLFLNFHSVGLRVEKIAEVGMMGYSGIIQECCRFLREDDCLVVINGLKSIDDWKLIKDTLLSEPTKGSIIIITEKESLAMYCADEKDRALSVDDLKADAVLRHWIKNFQFYRTGGKEEGRFFSTRMNRAREWTDMFGDADISLVPQHLMFLLDV
uniref:Uncharacterized protein n=1 Tax=Avena sativa TaxID=4498 RepID=A0ACD5WLQ2_AVESA